MRAGPCGCHEDVGLGARGDGVTEAVVEVVGALDVVADGHLSTAATQSAQVARVQWAGTTASGCSEASQRPVLAMFVRMLLRTFTVSAEVSYQRCR
jgi:hypothetical protein